MRQPLFVALTAAACLSACSSDKAKSDAPPAGSEAIVPPGEAAIVTDAFPLTTCTPTAGSAMTGHLIGKVTGRAILATSPPNDGRLFVIEEAGRIRLFESETLVATPFLDIANLVESGNDEQGLLGLAFDPDYATNRYFYVDYTADNPDTTDTAHPYVDVVYRYKQSASNPDVADPTTATLIISVPDPFVNHNGGMIEFGSDGFLYIGTGDGGSAGDPQRNGQNTNALLAKILRIDVAHPANGKPYGIPASNPFATSGGAPEVWLYGVRNPWRWTFDRATGDMWIGDVGQGQTEEIDVLTPAQQPGANLGWSSYEGDTCCATQADKCAQHGTQQACDTTGKMFPAIQKTHGGDGWLAIIGGQVYRGTCFPDIVGTYFYTDDVHGGLSAAKLDSTTGVVTTTDLTSGTFAANPSSIHADARGELYETATNGQVFHLVAVP